MTGPTRRTTLRGALGLTAVALMSCSADDRTRQRPPTLPAPADPFDRSRVHLWDLSIADSEFRRMIESFVETGEKDWIDARADVDGHRFQGASLRLKGNSSLANIDDEPDPVTLPWLLDLQRGDKSEATLGGRAQLVIRSSSMATAINESVALALLGKAGLTTQRSLHARTAFNGSDARLRLVVENLDSRWEKANFPSPGCLYKAEAGGDYRYRDTNPESYREIFDQETGESEIGFQPLIEFLRFINTASRDTFSSEIDRYLDVPRFARYLAFERLIRNADDISGLGNNSYLRYTTLTGRMTVVAWDHNLAFSGVERPLDDPAAQEPPGDGDDGQTRTAEPNVLVERMVSLRRFRSRFDRERERLRLELFVSGRAHRILADQVEVIRREAGDLVEQDVLRREERTVRQVLDSLR